jgi:hypothetical protein
LVFNGVLIKKYPFEWKCEYRILKGIMDRLEYS